MINDNCWLTVGPLVGRLSAVVGHELPDCRLLVSRRVGGIIKFRITVFRYDIISWPGVPGTWYL